ncbi:hypothetical protein [uncultured Bdellovibrio sp.]|uniref:hypothetical protein n=1 Tax=Bdellovibrio sp. HCB-162 TaxID=3394234 RepID=UPI0025CC611E|nr:hypothetical protein [uncultured Bdellovibrio sp.]
MVKYLQRLLMAFCLLLGCQVVAVPISMYMDPSAPGYYKLVLSRLLQWYEQKTGAPILEKLSPEERKYIQYCLEHMSDWGYQVSPNSTWNYFRLTVSSNNGKLKTRRLAMGPTVWTGEAEKMAEAILRKRSIHFLKGKKASDLLWLEWNLDENVFAVYYKESLSDIKTSIPHPELYEEKALRGVFYRNNKQTAEKFFVSYKTNPEELKHEVIFSSRVMQTVDVIADSKREARILELRSFDDRFMKGPIAVLADAILSEFNMPADSMLYRSPEDMELYYP